MQCYAVNIWIIIQANQLFIFIDTHCQHKPEATTYVYYRIQCFSPPFLHVPSQSHTHLSSSHSRFLWAGFTPPTFFIWPHPFQTPFFPSFHLHLFSFLFSQQSNRHRPVQPAQPPFLSRTAHTQPISTLILPILRLYPLPLPFTYMLSQFRVVNTGMEAAARREHATTRGPQGA